LKRLSISMLAIVALLALPSAAGAATARLNGNVQRKK
jgi:hypothetical protein